MCFPNVEENRSVGKMNINLFFFILTHKTEGR
jgi:hypothetical protein